MTNDSLWIGIFNNTVANFNVDRVSAIEAWVVDTHIFTTEKPADRQRFKSSLGKPFLLAVNRDPELGRLIVEWGE